MLNWWVESVDHISKALSGEQFATLSLLNWSARGKSFLERKSFLLLRTWSATVITRDGR